MYWDAIRMLTARQHNLVTRSQILALGGTVGGIRWALRDQRLAQLRHGVYAVAGATSEYQPIMGACLAAGPASAASHLAAAAIWGADQVKAGKLEITTFDNGFHRLPGVITHRSRLDAATAITRRLNIPIVVPPLTVVQVAETCHPHLAKNVANSLVKQNWTNFNSILEWIDAVDDGRTPALRDMCLRAAGLGGHFDSPAARTLGEGLLAAGVPPFEMDYPVDTPDGLVLLDYAWPSPMLGLEYNGAADHDPLLAKARDARRRAHLTAMGWRMLDANSAVTHAEVVQWVFAALAATPAAR